MNRRHMLKCCMAGVAVSTFAGPMSANASGDAIGYSRELFEEIKASGKPFLLDFSASW